MHATGHQGADATPGPDDADTPGVAAGSRPADDLAVERGGLGATLRPRTYRARGPTGGAVTVLHVRVSAGTETGHGEAAFDAADPAAARTARALSDHLAHWDGTLPGPADPDVAALPPAARHAWSSACADLEARRARLSVARLLAGAFPPRTVVPLGATIPDAVQEGLEAHVDAARDRGATRLDILAGGDLDTDMWRIRRVRERAGDAVRLRVDAQGRWSRSEARHAFPLLRALGVAVVVSPLAADDLEGHAMLRRLDEVPVALDVSRLARHAWARVLDARTADHLRFGLQAVGGPADALAVASRAAETGMGCILDVGHHTRVGLLHAVHTAAAHPAFRDGALWDGVGVADDPTVGGARMRHGRYRVGREDGIAVDDVAPGRGPAA